MSMGMGEFMDFAAEPFLANKAKLGDGFSPLGTYRDFTADTFLANKFHAADAFLPLAGYNAINPTTGFAGLGSQTTNTRDDWRFGDLNDDPGGSMQLQDAAPWIDAATLITGMAGLPEDGKVMMRPRDGAPPGWPGFFGWLAATHPGLYNYARVTLPNYVEDRQGNPFAGSQLGADGDLSPDILAQIVNTPIAIVPAGLPASEGITNSAPAQTTQASGNIAAIISQAGSALLQYNQQKAVLDVQLKRAQAGLPPLDTSRYVDPNAGINVGLNKGTQSTLLMLGAVAVGGLLLYKLLGRR